MSAAASGSRAHAFELLALAQAVLDARGEAIYGAWPRAVAIIGRQALEAAVDAVWEEQMPDLAKCSMRAQLLCLASYRTDRTVVDGVVTAWSGLSRACHHHVYELAPTAEELRGWLGAVERFAEAAAQMAREETT